MESPTYDLLVANSALTALVPAARVFKSGFAGDSPVAPYITIQEIGGVPENYMAGRPGMDRFRPTVKVCSKDEAQCKQIARIVRDTLELDAQCIVFDGPEVDAETRLFVHMSDWNFLQLR